MATVQITPRTCPACRAAIYGPRAYHAACERALPPAPRLTIAPTPKPAPQRATSARHKALPAPAVVARARKPTRRPVGLLGLLVAKGAAPCPKCRHYLAPEHAATCDGSDVLLRAFGDLEGFTGRLTTAGQLENEARRLAHAAADRKTERGAAEVAA